MLLITSSSRLMEHQLSFTKLSDSIEHLPIAAKWVECEWGYIRNKGIEYREGLMDCLKDSVFIATYAEQPVAMFALLNHEFHEDLLKAPGAVNLPSVLELMYVYVEKDYRGLGFGRQIINAAKKLAQDMGAERIQLDTLNPRLNSMYEKLGAKQLCEHHLFSHSTDLFTMKL